MLDIEVQICYGTKTQVILALKPTDLFQQWHRNLVYLFLPSKTWHWPVNTEELFPCALSKSRIRHPSCFWALDRCSEEVIHSLISCSNEDCLKQMRSEAVRKQLFPSSSPLNWLFSKLAPKQISECNISAVLKLVVVELTNLEEQKLAPKLTLEARIEGR